MFLFLLMLTMALLSAWVGLEFALKLSPISPASDTRRLSVMALLFLISAYYGTGATTVAVSTRVIALLTIFALLLAAFFVTQSILDHQRRP